MIGQPQQPLVASLQFVSQPHAAHAARAHLVPLQPQFVRHALLATRRMGERVLEDLGLDLGCDAIRVRTAWAALLLDE